MTKPQPRLGLNLKVAQKQILTPGLVQMVTVLALNKLELREMINQEMVENPVLEEVTDIVPVLEEVQKKNESEPTLATPSHEASSTMSDHHDPFEEVDYGSFFNDYLDPGYKSPASEDIEKPSFENFVSRPTSLSDHLQWQVNLSPCSEAVRDAAYSIIGNLNEDGYLTATLEEVAQAGEHKLEDVKDALALIQELDPAGVGARDLRECLLIQLRMRIRKTNLPCASSRSISMISKASSIARLRARWIVQSKTWSGVLRRSGDWTLVPGSAITAHCRG